FGPSTIDVAMDAGGDFVVAYQVSGEGGAQVLAHRYGVGGTDLGSSFAVGPEGSSASRPSVAKDSAGNFVVAFLDGGFEEPLSIPGRGLDPAGNSLGGPIQVSTDATAPGFGTGPSVADDGAGNFVVTWNAETDGGNEIVARRFDAAGSPLDDP